MNFLLAIETMVQKAGGHEGLLFLDVVANTQKNPIVHIFSRVKYTLVGVNDSYVHQRALFFPSTPKPEEPKLTRF